MKLLIYRWNSFTNKDIEATLSEMGICFETFTFDKTKDRDSLIEFVEKTISTSSCDALFSVNFFSVIAEACHRKNLPYLSWCYDSSIDLWSREVASYPTNYMFHFDRDDAASIKEMTKEMHIYHLPLAVNVERFDKIRLNSEDRQIASADISFVGALYDSKYAEALSELSDYDKAYLNALFDVQFDTYGTNLLTFELLNELTERIRKPGFVNTLIGKDDPNTFSASALQYHIYQHIAHRERIILLELLARHYRVKLFSTQSNEILSNVEIHPAINYETDMPKVFKASAINLNITQRRIFSGIPQRCLDIMACGGFLLSNYQSELATMQSEGACALYESIEDAYEKTSYYLTHEDERKRIAANGRKIMLEEFRYEDRLKEIFRISELRIK